MFVANESKRLRGQCHFVTAPPGRWTGGCSRGPRVQARRGNVCEGDNVEGGITGVESGGASRGKEVGHGGT
jgi:hypothetical protein